jgi:hypothetical protein
MLKASEQKRPAFAGRILYLSFMFCETKGEKERRPNKESDDLEEERAVLWNSPCEDTNF